MATTVYTAQGDLERLVCAGHVINIQQNDLVQIKVSRTGAGLQNWKDIWRELDAKRAHSLIIRPGLYQGSFADDGLQ